MIDRLKRFVALVFLSSAVALASAASASAMDPALTWYGHAAFKYSTRSGHVFLIDPWITNPKAPKDIEFRRIDGILITHGHSDHVEKPSISPKNSTRRSWPVTSSP